MQRDIELSSSSSKVGGHRLQQTSALLLNTIKELDNAKSLVRRLEHDRSTHKNETASKESTGIHHQVAEQRTYANRPRGTSDEQESLLRISLAQAEAEKQALQVNICE